MTESTKTVDGTISKYEYVGDQLLFEQRGEKAIHYVYDSFGNVMAAVYKANASDTEHIYYYAHNWRGDVVALYTSTGNIFARYEYDAWGKLLSVKNGYGNIITSPANFALINPIRYRGYYYDSESGLYYLQSRYYDPTTGRFVNGDSVGILSEEPENLIMYNFYTYCWNNPTNLVDEDGYWPKLTYKHSVNYVFFKLSFPWSDISNYLTLKGIYYGIVGMISSFIPEPVVSKIVALVTGSISAVYSIACLYISNAKNGQYIDVCYSFNYRIKARKIFKYIIYTRWMKIGFWTTYQYAEIYNFKFWVRG